MEAAKKEATISSILDDIVAREGGFVNHPNDKGGPTKYGITQATLSRERGKRVSAKDVAQLTANEAKAIYYRTYIKPFVGVGDRRLMALIADSSVHHGATRTIKWLQQAVGTAPDGRLGPESWKKLKGADPAKVYERLLNQRAQHIEKLGQSGSQGVFLEGWRKRLEAFDNEGGIPTE